MLLDEGVLLLEPLDELLEGALDEPPEAESFFVASDEALDEDDGELGVVALPDAEPDADDGELGVVVEPADEDEPEPGAVEVREALLPALSPHAATPRARETAAAKIESFIWWASVGWGKGKGARNGPVLLRS